ncbi:MAG: LPS export ABC transporter periplasmic protein LptC [Chitinophagales bacterium]
MRLAGALLWLMMALSACKNDLNEARLVTARANVNIEHGTDIEIRYSDHGKTKIKAFAPSATRFNAEQPYMEFSKGLKIYFYHENGEVQSTMTAEYATAVENSSQMTARKNVEVINEKGEKLNTEELIWDENKKIIYSNSALKITTADEIILGNGMEADETFTNYSIHHITGIVKVKAEVE